MRWMVAALALQALTMPHATSRGSLRGWACSREPQTTAGSHKRRAELARYLQTFPYVGAVNLGPGNVLFELTMVPSRSESIGCRWLTRQTEKFQEDSSSLALALTSSELNYDDYTGLNATGKIAIALQGTPDGDNPHGQFARLQMRWKTIAARNAGARALIVIAREGTLANDRLANLTYDNTAGEAGLPVIVISRQSLDKILHFQHDYSSDFEKAITAKTPGTNER